MKEREKEGERGRKQRREGGHREKLDRERESENGTGKKGSEAERKKRLAQDIPRQARA